MTGKPLRTDVVQVLDLRGWAGGALPPVSGLVIAVDDEATLRAHHAAYYSLIDDDQVHDLLCLVVGAAPATPDEQAARDGAVVRVPGVLGRHAGLLWVGDEHGVSWGAAADRPRPAGAGEPTALLRLVDALRAPEVFEQVLAAVRTFPDHAASPGFHLYSHIVDADDLQEAARVAVGKVTEMRTDAATPPALRDPEEFAAEAQLPGVHFTSQSPVDASRSRVTTALEVVEESARQMVRLRALRGSARPGDVLPDQLLAAADGAERYHVVLVELLRRIDGNLRVRQPPADEVVELGLQHPAPPRPEAVAGAVRTVVTTTLARHPSLPTLAAQLRAAAAAAAPQGCTRAWTRMKDRPPIGRSVPVFRRWVLPLATLPLIFLSCLALAVLPPVQWLGYVLGFGFAAAWYLVGAVLLARRPDEGGELGMEDAALPALFTYGVAGLLGAGLGVTAVRLVPEAVRSLVAVPAWYTAAAGAVTFLLIVLLGTTAWTGAARRWVKEMDIPGLRADVKQMTDEVSGVVVTQWLPSARRRRVEMAFIEVAGALEETGRALEKHVPDAFAGVRPVTGPAPIVRSLQSELLAVVGTDLLGLTDYVLGSAWQAIETNRPLGRGAYGQRTVERLDDYAAHIGGGHFLTPPTFVTDAGPRHRLIARQWTDDPAAVASMRTKAVDEMTQLCQARQLRNIDREEPGRLLRFAPHPVRAVLEADPAPNRTVLEERPIWTAANDHAGSLRLLPLRLGSIDTREPVSRHD